MKTKLNPKTGTPVYSDLNDKDLTDAFEISLTMKTKGWKILQDYLTVGRELMIEAGKKGIKLRSKKDLSPEKWAILEGWDECSVAAEQIVVRAMKYKEQQTNKEADNGGTQYGGEE